jgi:hypothetical protein
MAVLSREGQIEYGKSRLETAAEKLGEELSSQFLSTLATTLTPERIAALYILVSDLDYLPPEARSEQVVEEVYRRFLREIRHKLNIDAALFAGVLNALSQSQDIEVRN